MIWDKIIIRIVVTITVTNRTWRRGDYRVVKMVQGRLGELVVLKIGILVLLFKKKLVWLLEAFLGVCNIMILWKSKFICDWSHK